MIGVFVVEDHTLVRQSLVALLCDAPDFEVVGEAGSIEEARGPILASPPDVLLLDVNLPGVDGLTFAAELGQRHATTRVMLLTMHDDAHSVRRAAEAFVNGYLTKTSTQDEVLTGLRAVASGGSCLSPAIAVSMMDVARGSHQPGHLTDRETLILQHLARGARAQEIATELLLSSKTVKNHLSHIYTKLGVESGAQAVVEAYRRGLVRA